MTNFEVLEVVAAFAAEVASEVLLEEVVAPNPAEARVVGFDLLRLIFDIIVFQQFPRRQTCCQSA